MEKKLVTVNGKELEVVKVDPAWMKEKYDLFKGMFFSTVRMPESSKISLEVSSRMRRTWGRAWWRDHVNRSHRRRGSYDNTHEIISAETQKAWGLNGRWLDGRFIKRNGKGKVPNNPATLQCRIQLNTSEFLPEVVFEGVLVHEMVHICCYNNNMWAGEGHDGWFAQIGDYITKASDGKYKIERYISQDDIDLRDLIKGGIVSEDEKSGFVVQFVLKKPSLIGIYRRKPVRTRYMWYWIPRMEQVNGFLAKASMDFDFLDPDNDISVAEIEKAIVYEASPDNIKNPKMKDWVEWAKNKCLVGNPSGGNPSVHPETIGKWFRLSGGAPSLKSAGALVEKDVVTNLFSGNGGVWTANPKPVQQAPAQPHGPMEAVKGMAPDERKDFYKEFFAWFKDATEDEKAKWLSGRQGSMTDQEVFLNVFLNTVWPQRKANLQAIRGSAAMGEAFDLDLSDEQRLSIITESMLGRAAGRVMEWLKGLVSSVFSSIWGKEEVIDNGDGTVWRVIS